MNSLETDLRRAVVSLRFLLAAALQLAALWNGGFDGTLYKISVPLVCTLPYACGFLEEYKDGFSRLALPRTSRAGYILGKFLAAALSGGAAEWLAAEIYVLLKWEEDLSCDFGLAFLSGMVWAAAAALLAAVSNSRYLAYGGSFVFYYFLVILEERYWSGLYALYPYEWLRPTHTWVFGNTGIVLLLLGLTLVLGLAYAAVLERRLSHV